MLSWRAWFAALAARDKEALLAVIRERPIEFHRGGFVSEDGVVAETIVNELIAEGRVRWVRVDERVERLEAT